MGSNKKRPHRFGQAAGRYRNLRKQNHLSSGKKKTTYVCYGTGKPSVSTNNGSIMFKIVRRHITNKYKTLLRPLKPVQGVNKYHKTYKSTSQEPVFDNISDGFRFINLGSLQSHVAEISMHAALCDKARDVALTGGSPIRLKSELHSYGLSSILSAQCSGCKHNFTFMTSPKLKNDKSKGGHFDINVRAVWGSLVTGNGRAHLNEFLACTDTPGIGQKTFTNIENNINKWWHEVLQKDLEKAIDEEKTIATTKGNFHQGVPAISVICDGGWSKRSHKHTYNANGGVAIIIGVETRKLLHVGVRNKFCYVCSQAEESNVKAKPHECFKNWDKSSEAMESDIIVEGFLKANEHGIRYTRIIGDGDSSVFARIREDVPVWGRDVEKIECANHACKCLRSNLENLVAQNPSYKGKGNLSKHTRIRIVSSVRCAIRMRSSIKDKHRAARLLEHDIKNSIFHIYGKHDRCSQDFCKAPKKRRKQSSSSMNTKDVDDGDDDDDDDDDLFGTQAHYWEEGTTVEEQEESRGDSTLVPQILPPDLLKDVSGLLERIASKSNRLLGNHTTNLAECWMHIRSKFDGGKVYNVCNRGSWHTRCYAGALRCNLGPTWSPQVWELSTGSKAGSNFTTVYERRENNLTSCTKSKAKPETHARRWKRKLRAHKESASKKAKREYGPDAIDVTADLCESELQNAKQNFFTKNVDVPTADMDRIEKESRSQSCSQTWKDQRRMRITSSNFGKVIRRRPQIKVAPLVRDILYSTFKGTSLTQNGINMERISRVEYINMKEKEGLSFQIHDMGLVIDNEQKFLACSPDGKVVEGDKVVGLIEIKNVLYNKTISLTQAAKMKNTSNFCLKYENGELSLKKNHEYFYQCQGLLNITRLPWLDFVVRTERPYEIHVERIWRDTSLWNSKMVPKLKQFYFEALLPELASPRKGKSPGIREPGIWYVDQRPTGKKPRLDVDSDVDTPSCSTSNIERRPNLRKCSKIHEAHVQPHSSSESQISQTSKPKRQQYCQNPKFIGRRISHQWIEEDSSTKWYEGCVLSLVEGVDGLPNAVYNVEYDEEDEVYEIDHLVEDYTASQVKFI